MTGCETSCGYVCANDAINGNLLGIPAGVEENGAGPNGASAESRLRGASRNIHSILLGTKRHRHITHQAFCDRSESLCFAIIVLHFYSVAKYEL